MIYNSYVWKIELRKIKRDFFNYQKTITTDVTFADWNEEEVENFNLQFEKFIFLSSFVIRKLLDSKKLSDEFESGKITCKKYDRFSNKKNLTYRNRLDDLDKHYNLKNRKLLELEYRNICNYIIHSFYISPIMGKNNLIKGFFVTSDREKKNFLLRVELSDYKRFINNAISDYIASFSWHYDDIKDNLIIRKSRKDFEIMNS